MARRVLDTEQVLVAAEALIDARGWDVLTMASLAGELGVKVPSLYSHVAGLDQVRAEVQGRMLDAVGRSLQEAAMGRTGADALRAMGAAYRAHALRHPHRYDGMTRRPIDRDGLLASSVGADHALRAALRQFDLDEQATFEAELSIFATAHGFLSLEIAGFWAGAADTERLYVEAVDRMIRSLQRHEEEVAP